jgi:hypothetical protein
MFALSKVYAHAVTPQRWTAESELVPPAGGAVQITTALREVIDSAFDKISASALTSVDFDFDGSRNHPVRDDAMALAFGATQAPRAAAARLATRLSRTMDDRSNSALLLVTVEMHEPKRRVSMLLLPHEVVVRMTGGNDQDYLVDVLRDAFSTASGLRKLARLSGHNNKSQFLSAEVLDLQLMSPHKSVADFWIREFLGARPRMDSETGSRQLAAALQRAFDAAPEDDREAAFAAMLKAGSGRIAKTSLLKYAEELPDDLREAYFRGTGDDELRRAVFDIDRSIIKTNLARRVITAADGVIISAPTETIGKSVDVRMEGSLRTVSYSGRIEKERVARGRKRSQE